MAAPKTKDWHARENAHKPQGLHLLVSGAVEVSALNKLPKLAPTDSRDPKVRGLALTIVDDPDEPAGDVMCWRQADYHEEVTHDQYTSVVIRWEGSVIKTIPVIDDREHHAAMEKQSDAQDAVAAKTIKLKPAKKPAAKKPKPKPKPAVPAKKAAPKKAKKVAKKAKKKTARKSAKKATKKSALKAFVKKVVKKLTPAKKKKKKR